MDSMKVLARSSDGRFLVGENPRPLSLARIVDLRTGIVSPELRIGSIMAQSDPDEWANDDGSSPEAQAALQLVTA